MNHTLSTESQSLSEQKFSKLKKTVAVGALSLLMACQASHEDGSIKTEESLTSSPTPEKKGSQHELNRYPEHTVMTSVFYIGETGDKSNDNISNVPTAWSTDARQQFGGTDHWHEERNFEPKHNTFYYALPMNEFDENGVIPGAREASPWADEHVAPGRSLFKGRWIAVESEGNDKTAYLQWIDTGPCGNDQPECLTDSEYVFGDAEPINDFGLKAGLDVSPDAAEYLGIDTGSGMTTWKFVDVEDVPKGPWTKYPPINDKTYW